MAHPRVDERLAGLDLVLVVFTEPAQPTPPAEGALNDPAVRLHGEGAAGLDVGPLAHRQGPAHLLAQVLGELPAVAGIRPDQGQARQVRPIQAQRLREQACPIAVLDIGSRDHYLEHDALGIDQAMPLCHLASAHLLMGVVAAEAPLCLVVTDWLSRIAALGVASRPRRRRVRSRRAVWIVSHVPSLRQIRK